MTSGPEVVLAGPVPLARLLASAYRWLIDELHRRLSERGWTDVRPSYGFVLLSLRDSAMTPTALARRLDITKQAASKLAEAMIGAELVSSSPHGTDGRQRELSLTSRGVQLLGVVEEIYAELEQEWADRIGRGRVEDVRASLTSVLTEFHSGVLPPVRPGP